MKSGITFQELAKLQAEQLAKQEPVTLEYARMQALWIKNSDFFTKKFSTEGSLEDAKKNAIEFLKNISGEDYMKLHAEFVNSQPLKIRKKSS